MDLPDYSEFLPNLRRAENALEIILDEEDYSQKNFQYYLEDKAFSGLWTTDNRKNEITVYHISDSNRVSIEGNSASRFGVASESIGTVHVSTIESMMSAQYGIIDALEPADFDKEPRK
ncbi:MAG: hypothetical protein R6V35_00680 [Candidatus Nanohaloarchaea archaeon]